MSYSREEIDDKQNIDMEFSNFKITWQYMYTMKTTELPKTNCVIFTFKIYMIIYDYVHNILL